jgi:hypothetical protein
MADNQNTRKPGWKKYFKVANTGGQLSPISGQNQFGLPNYPRQTGVGFADGTGTPNDFAFRNYASRLPEVYSGHPNRIERYNQYENMDCDSEVNACLDIIAEFSTQVNDDNGTPFNINFTDRPTDHEVEIVKKQLQQWTKLNKLDQRVFKLFRNTIKYGDQLFVRDPETFEMMWVDMVKVARVIVNESEGKRPEQYIIRDINPNFQNMSVAQKTTSDYYVSRATGSAGQNNYTAPNGGGYGGAGGGTGNSRFTQAMNETCIDARHVVHLSLNEGLDYFWPFGQSILENIFKVFKQKELLEDSVLIYRVQRAPERRIFKIDVGNMPSHMAMQFVERVKNEMHQRRIPTTTGGGANMMDASYNPLCLDLNTRIPLLDGRTLSLSELIAEFESGKENWAYSCNPATGEIVPGVINWAGVTRKNTSVIKLTFDNGKELICTPDHKIPVFGKGFVEAKDLTVNDSLIAFNTQQVAMPNSKNTYQQVWDHASKSWKWTHRIVGEFFRQVNKHQEFTYLPENAGKTKAVIHHKDANRYNNDPRNLTYMNKEDHILYHASQKKEFWETMSNEYRLEITDKISTTLKQRWTNLTKQERLEALWNIRSAQKKSVSMRQTDPAVMASYKKNASESRKKYIATHPEFLNKLNSNLKNRVKIKNQTLNLTFDMLQRVADKVKAGHTNKNKILSLCDTDAVLLSMVQKENSCPLNYKNAQCKINFAKFGYSKLNRLIEKFGYKNWKSFVNEIDNFNHRIVKIEAVSNRDTGTITIDGTEKWHDFHTFAIESGIFVKNSINEDYFFPVTSEGRGSDVTTLPGGANLGEIDDLKYFNNKMARGLRVPSSYLPTGPDDSDRALNDGKVGTALIQEYRFNQYCMRLQRLIMQKLDDEFKMFLRWRGFNIDAGLFSISFCEPQNFASYRQSELDTSRIASFAQLEAMPYMSKRFMMKRYLGLTEEEIVENETLWKEERDEPKVVTTQGQDLRSIGITPAGIESDIATGEELGSAEPGADAGGAEGGMPGAPTTAPGIAAPPAPTGGVPGV